MLAFRARVSSRPSSGWLAGVVTVFFFYVCWNSINEITKATHSVSQPVRPIFMRPSASLQYSSVSLILYRYSGPLYPYRASVAAGLFSELSEWWWCSLPEACGHRAGIFQGEKKKRKKRGGLQIFEKTIDRSKLPQPLGQELVFVEPWCFDFQPAACNSARGCDSIRWQCRPTDAAKAKFKNMKIEKYLWVRPKELFFSATLLLQRD